MLLCGRVLLCLRLGALLLLLGLLNGLGFELLPPLSLQLALLVALLLLFEEQGDGRKDPHSALDDQSAQRLHRRLADFRLRAGHFHDFTQDRVDGVHEAVARAWLAVVKEDADALRVAVAAQQHAVILELVVLVAQVLDDQQAAHEPRLGKHRHRVKRLLSLNILPK